MNPKNINEIYAVIEVVDGKETGVMGWVLPSGQLVPLVYGGDNEGVCVDLAVA